jgi:hypothetical protein
VYTVRTQKEAEDESKDGKYLGRISKVYILGECVEQELEQ